MRQVVEGWWKEAIAKSSGDYSIAHYMADRAYAKGLEDMRERAADACVHVTTEDRKTLPTVIRTRSACADAIRALPLEQKNG